jgi:hypothetical protein
MRVTFKEVVLRNLIAACIAAIPKEEKQKEKENQLDLSEKDLEKIKELSSQLGINETYQAFFSKFMGIIHKDDRLTNLFGNSNGGYLTKYNVLSVVKVVKDGSSHSYKNGLYIVTNPKHGYLLSPGGGVEGTHVQQKDVESATESEIAECVASLNDAQFKTVMRHDIFLPVVKAAMDEEFEEIPLVAEQKPA